MPNEKPRLARDGIHDFDAHGYTDYPFYDGDFFDANGYRIDPVMEAYNSR